METSLAPGQFGVITMAESPVAVARACGLASSLDATGEQIPRALLHQRDLAVPAGFFDVTIKMPDDPFKGRWFYLNKLVHPFALTPFTRTLFLDSDVLVHRPLTDFVMTYFTGKPVALCVRSEPVDSTASLGNHFIPKRFVQAFATRMVQNPDGGGHMYFESGPDCASIVARALKFATGQEDLYHQLTGNNYDFVADELVLLAILTIDDIVLPAGLDAVHAVQPDEVEAVAALLRRGEKGKESIRDKAKMFHFFGQAKTSETYRRLLTSIPARWFS